MTQPLKAAPEPFAPHYGEAGQLRQLVGDSGRVHLDRHLPFLVLHRGTGDPDSLARRIALDSPAYLVWDEADDHAALQALDGLVEHLAADKGRLLVITLADAPYQSEKKDSATLAPFLARVDRQGGDGADRAAEKLADAVGKIRLDLRRCKVDSQGFATPLPPRFDALLADCADVDRLRLMVPQVHRRADGGTYPGISHDLAVAFGDALLRAACAFLDDGSGRAPAHYRALGRSAYLAAALKADRKLAAVASSFDFLLSISPIDTAKACEKFLDEKCEKPPEFHYRPLTVDPDLAKRALYAIDLGHLEDPLIERLLTEKRREVDAQLTMLATRNTPAFRPASMFLYGAVDSALLSAGLSILASTAKDPARGGMADAHDVAEAARALVETYAAQDEAFAPAIELRDDVAGLMVSGPKLMIGSGTLVPENRVQPLLAHEVSVHLLTWFNGAEQGLGLFSTGLAGYEGVQEGLGVFAEWMSGGLTRTRLRLLAARVVAVDAMLRGASFIDCYRLLTHDHGFRPRSAFGICARVYRSGGLAKDAIYLQGFHAVIGLVASGASLDPFWMGKIAVQHSDAVEELLQRGLAHAPRFIPDFMRNEQGAARIAALRADGGVDALWSGE